jgi:hypothetical protein
LREAHVPAPCKALIKRLLEFNPRMRAFDIITCRCRGFVQYALVAT